MPTKDVAPGYLASLPAPAAVLTALRKARRARLGILGGALHSQQTVVGLLHPSLSALPYGLASIGCSEVRFSFCGQYLALTFYATRNSGAFFNTELQHDKWMTNTGVMIFRAGGACFERTFFMCSARARIPIMQWAADKPHLSIAQLPNAPRQQPRQQLSKRQKQFQHDNPSKDLHFPSAFVVDAPTGGILHALGPVNDRTVQELSTPSSTTLQWSASGRLLLLVSSSEATGALADPEASHQMQGRIEVYDVQQDRLLVRSEYLAHSLSEAMCFAIWCPACPSPGGLVLSCGVQLQDPAAFSLAGFAIGVLPDGCFLRVANRVAATTFSPDGQRLAVRCFIPNDSPAYDDSWGPRSDESLNLPEKEYRILRCRAQGSEILTWDDSQKRLLEGHGCSWLSDTKVVLGMYADYYEESETAQPSKIANVVGAGKSVQLQGLPLQPPVCRSSSALFLGDSADGPRILSIKSGEQLWAAKADARIEAKLGKFTKCAAFLPSGCGVVCARHGRYPEGGGDFLDILSWA